MNILEYFCRQRSVLCIVAETTGSCPGKTGFKMAVPAEGPPAGSVGGGNLEYSVINSAREMLRNGLSEPVLSIFRHTSEAEPHERSGMICSGSQKLILIPPPPLNRLSGESNGFCVTSAGLEFLTSPPAVEGLKEMGDRWFYSEAVKPPPVVYIFGGGHCSLALTPVLNSLNMRTVIVDDRENLWTMEENNLAWQRIRMDYSEAGSLVPDYAGALVLIMTASHKADALVLEQVLGKKLKYLGMMASRATADHVVSLMRSKGFTEEQLSAVHSPVGLPIGSHTPAEIAVSIAAEIITEMNL